MASYTEKVSNVTLETYKDTINLIEKIESVVDDEIKRSYHFHFKTGSLTCVANSKKEFIDVAYGSKNFNLISFQLMYFLPNEEILHLNYLSTLSISASTRFLLQKYTTAFGFDTGIEPSKGTNNLREKDNVSIVINGDINGNGIILSNQGSAEIKNEKKPINKENFWRGLLQNIISTVISSVILKVLLSFSALAIIITPFLHSYDDANNSPTNSPSSIISSPTPIASVSNNKVPSADDLSAIDAKICYPKETKYLDEYRYGTINAPKKDSVNGYYYSKEGEIYFYPHHGEKITVIALQDFRACVIVESEQKACWINSDYILYE